MRSAFRVKQQAAGGKLSNWIIHPNIVIESLSLATFVLETAYSREMSLHEPCTCKTVVF